MNPLKISFLATGDELIQGDTQDTNGGYFARTLHDQGAKIYQHMQVSDNIDEICAALRYLLEHSEAVVICGGLGPTSDDNTRFAVSKVTGRELEFHEDSWQKIIERFKQFKLNLVPSNRQQALFPAGAIVYPNPNGSAPGCYLPWEGKHIFMVPGPPRECRPMFDTHIVGTLEQLKFYDKKPIYRWLTMGLSESEVGEKIDAIAKPAGFETGYRWSYPYLEVKIFAQDHDPDLNTIDQIHSFLEPLCVSTHREDAIMILDKALETLDKPIHVVDEITDGFTGKLLDKPGLIFTDKATAESESIRLIVHANPTVISNQMPAGTITLSSKGYVNDDLIHEQSFTVPMRGPDVLHYVRAYLAWQLARFIEKV